MKLRIPALFAACCLLASAALAQTAPNRHFPAHRLEPAIDAEGMGNTEWAGIPDHLAWDAALLFGYENDPLYSYTPQNGLNPLERSGVLVENRLHANLIGAISLFEWVELGVELPVVLFQNRDAGRVAAGDDGSDLAVLGVGDLRLVPKVGILRQKSGNPLDLAVLLPVTLPSGQFADFMGSETFSVTPMVAVSRRFGDFKLAGNMGHRFRPDVSFLDLSMGNELIYRAAIGYQFMATSDTPTEVSANIAGAAATGGLFRGGNLSIARNPLEVIGEIDHTVWGPVHVVAGGGVGIASNYGGPDYRFYGGVRFASRPAQDADGDGIVGDADKCPQSAETKNDFEDSDGCPDNADADGDGVMGDADKCPNAAEEKNGIDDADGCPDNDLDGDGILNEADKCKDSAEDKDGHDDADGCPDVDDDNDGVADTADQCKDKAEDKDGFKDEDGCPEDDNDADGVLDDKDQCPIEAGVPDNRGCPDADKDGDTVVDRLDNCPDEAGAVDNGGCKQKQLVVLTASKIEIKDKVYFDTGKDVIQSKSFALLDNVAQVLSAHPEIKRISIEGHTDNVGDAAKNKALSDRRAKAVVKYLTGKGVDAARLSGVGFGAERPVADNATDAGRANNRRVDFVIVND